MICPVLRARLHEFMPRELDMSDWDLFCLRCDSQRDWQKRGYKEFEIRYQRSAHFHRPTHNRPGRQCSTVTASSGTSAAASNRAQSSSRKARRKDTGPSCRTNRCHRMILTSQLNIRELRSDRSRSLMNQPTCAVASIHRSSATISLILQMMRHQRTHNDIHRFLRPILESVAGHPSDPELLRR